MPINMEIVCGQDLLWIKNFKNILKRVYTNFLSQSQKLEFSKI